MRRFRLNPRSSLVLLLGAGCIALVLLSGVVQAAHFHALGQVDHDCALCVAAHQMAHVPALVALLLTCRALASIAAPSSIHHPRRPVYFRLVSRPPPADSLLFT